MKASEVMKLLKISRPTFYRYKKQGWLKGRKMLNGYYNYDDKIVYKLLAKGVQHKTCLYARVSTPKQKKDLENQIEQLKNWAIQQGFPVHGIYKDIASGISFEKRKGFFALLEQLLAYQVERVIISYKDRMSRVGFGLFNYLFQNYGAEIIVISDITSPKLELEEITEEIISLLHSFSMKMYSRRRRNKNIEISFEQPKKKSKDLENILKEKD